MKTSNYLYVSHSQMYGMLHGMHTGGCLDNIDERPFEHYFTTDPI